MWSLTLKKAYRLRVSENRVLMEKLEPKTAENCTVRSFYNRYYLGYQIKEEMSGARGLFGEDERCIQGFGRKI
jgi:hypothetical protein